MTVYNLLSGYHPSSLRGDKQPQYTDNPRETMLKDADEPGQSVRLTNDINAPEQTKLGPPEPLVFSGHFKFPPLVIDLMLLIVETKIGFMAENHQQAYLKPEKKKRTNC